MSNGPNVSFHYLYFNYFVLNITLPLLSSTISRLMGLTHCHQVLEPSSSSVPCFAQLSDTAEAPSTLQTVVIQYEAGSLIMPLRPTKCDAQLLTPFMLLPPYCITPVLYPESESTTLHYSHLPFAYEVGFEIWPMKLDGQWGTLKWGCKEFKQTLHIRSKHKPLWWLVDSAIVSQLSAPIAAPWNIAVTFLILLITLRLTHMSAGL